MILSNPRAGRGQATGAGKKLLSQLRKSGHDAGHLTPSSLAEATDTVAREGDRGAANVVVAGGDGSLHGLLDATVEAGMTLGVLPLGRGNDFVRGMGLPTRVGALATAVLGGRTKTVDLGVVNGKLFGTILSSGLDAEVGMCVTGGSALQGMAGYLFQAIKSLTTFSGYEIRVTVDDEVVAEGGMSLVACANTPTYGGGFRIAPGADPADGQLDVCVVRQVSRLKALGVLPKVAFGEHAGDPDVTFFRGTNLKFQAESGTASLADGEPLVDSVLEVGVKPSVLRVVC